MQTHPINHRPSLDRGQRTAKGAPQVLGAVIELRLILETANQPPVGRIGAWRHLLQNENEEEKIMDRISKRITLATE
jgi:hypothetical protein